MNTPYANIAINDRLLFNSIIAHRRKYTAISGVDYDTHALQTICFIPPKEVIALWQSDYKDMGEMFYGEVLGFDELIARIATFNRMLNNLE